MEKEDRPVMARSDALLIAELQSTRQKLKDLADVCIMKGRLLKDSVGFVSDHAEDLRNSGEGALLYLKQ
jgi:hypothetical protein